MFWNAIYKSRLFVGMRYGDEMTSLVDLPEMSTSKGHGYPNKAQEIWVEY
jgi:hypothetical protein